MKIFLDKLCGYAEILGAVLFGIMSLTTFFQVLCRYFLDYSLAWTGELSTFLFVWVTMIGAAIATHRVSHINITVLNAACPRKLSLMIGAFAQISILIVSLIITITGFSFAMKNMSNISIALHVPLFIPILSLFTGGLLMAIFCLGVIGKIYTDMKGEIL